MKNVLAFITVLSCILQLNAQTNETTTVGLTPFGYTYGIEETKVRMIYNHVAEMLSCNDNITLVDRSTWGDLTQEREKQDDAEFRNSVTYQQGKSAGADVLITGYIYEAQSKRTETGYGDKISIKLGLDLVNVTTGETTASKTFSLKGMSEAQKLTTVGNATGIGVLTLAGSLGTLGKKDKDDFHEALQSVEKEVGGFLKYHYPGDYNCMQSSRVKKTSLVDNIFGGNGSKEVQYFDFFPLADGEIAVQGKKSDGLTKFNTLSLVKETYYERTSGNGEKMTGTSRKELAKFKVKQYDGDRTILAMKGGSQPIDQMIEQARMQSNADDELKFYVIFSRDLTK